jgi:hypothetical protein
MCKCQNRNFSLAETLNFDELLRYQKVMGYYDFWICCDCLNGENFKPNFISFGVKLKDL